MRWLFLMGLVRGVSTVIGVTVVAAIAFTILSRMITPANNLPLINQFIESTGIEEVINQQVE